MVERIGSTDAMQSMAIRSVKPSEDVKAQDTSAKEQSVAQTGESSKQDSFERSGEVSLYGSPDDAKARAAFDKEHSTEQTSNPRRFDRYEFSEEDSLGSYANQEDGVNVHNMSETDLPAEGLNEAHGNGKSGSGEEIASSSQSALSDSSSESVDTSKLYQYTDKELKDLLLDGSITQREYDAEMEKREY